MASASAIGPGPSQRLLANKTVVRLVAVKGANHIIPVAPGVRARRVVFVAVGFGVAREVQPVAPPALAVVRGSQQTVEHFLIGIRRSVREKRVAFRERQRNGRSDRKLRGAAGKLRLDAGRQFSDRCAELRENSDNGSLTASSCRDCGGPGVFSRLKGPVRAVLPASDESPPRLFVLPRAALRAESGAP